MPNTPSASHPWRQYDRARAQAWLDDNHIHFRTDGTSTIETRVKSNRHLLPSRYSEHEEDPFRAFRDPYTVDSDESGGVSDEED